MRETRDQVRERLRNRQELPKDREAGYSIRDCPNCSEPVWFGHPKLRRNTDWNVWSVAIRRRAKAERPAT